jgi:hypothetical protein
MLLVSALALTTATYAWFTKGDTGNVGEFTLQAVESNGIQLSADAKKWKPTITKVDDLDVTGLNNLFPKGSVNPVSAYGLVEGGVLKMFSGSVSDDGFFTATAVDSSNQDYTRFNFYVKNDGAAAVNLNLTDDASVTDADSTSNKTISKAVRVAFIVQGTASSADVATNASNITNKTLSGSSTAMIWEPNSDGATTYAINQAIGSSAGAVLQTNNIVESSTYTSEQKTNTSTTIATIGSEQVVKITVYIWFEGQDTDCKSSNSNSKININLKFEGKAQTTTSS